MSDHVTQYKKELKKNLRCSSNVKERLMGKFGCSLSTFLDDKPTPDMDELCTAFGSPKEMALVLMEEVTPKEAVHYRTKNTIIRIVITILVIALLSCSIYALFYKEIPIEHDDHVDVNNTFDTDEEIIVDDEFVIED